MTSLINNTSLDRFSSNPDVVRHLIQVYLESAQKTVEKIDASVASGDTEQVAWHAHSLKGSSAELGAEQLAELCQQLQVVAKAGDRESIAVLAQDLARCYTETIAGLAALAIG